MLRGTDSTYNSQRLIGLGRVGNGRGFEVWVIHIGNDWLHDWLQTKRPATGRENEGSGVSRSGYQATIVKSGGREGLARDHRNLEFKPASRQERRRKGGCQITLSGWTPAIGACDDTARSPLRHPLCMIG